MFEILLGFLLHLDLSYLCWYLHGSMPRHVKCMSCLFHQSHAVWVKDKILSYWIHAKPLGSRRRRVRGNTGARNKSVSAGALGWPFFSLKHRPRMHSLHCGKLPKPRRSLNSHRFKPRESDGPWTWTVHDQNLAFSTIWVCRQWFQPNKYSDGMDFIWKSCSFSWKLQFLFLYFFAFLLLT